MAMTGANFGGKCYASAQDAAHVYFSQLPLSVTNGTTAYVSRFEFSTASNSWRHKQFSVSSTGVWTQRSDTAMPTPTFPLCDPAASFLDGVLIGWGVVIAMVAAAAVNFLKRGARGG